MSEVRNRLKTYIQSQGCSEAEFERRCGLSRGYVSSIKNAITPEKALNIMQCFPSLNFDWLLTGRGEPSMSEGAFFLSQTERSRWEEMVRTRQERIGKLEAEIIELQSELDFLRSKTTESNPR